VAAARYVETGSQEDRSLAEGYFAAAERLRPLWSTVHQRWADMCDRRMQKTGLSPDLMEKAMLHYDKAIELYPSNPWFYYYRGLLAERASGEWPSYAKVAFDSYKAAMEYYEKVGNLHLIFPPQTYLNIGARIKGLAENLGVQPPPMPKVRK
jgi:tetratricopeptide (TPR) repeat protein